MSKSSRLTVLCAVLLLCAATAFAASQNAVLYGTVYDAGAAPLAGVTVTLENPAIGFSRTTTTASDGSYSFSEVPPATGYKLTAAQGGKTIDIRGSITVNVGEESVIAPPLKAQATPAVVEKTAQEMAVTTEKVATAQSGVITGDQLRSLPLYNRNFLALGTLTPNTHDLGAADPLNGASFSVAGNRGVANNFLLDGADNVASSSNQAVPFQVNDAIQEFRVISSGGQAEYGRAQGGTINVVTRRGTNSWHGSAFGYFANDMFNSEGPLSVYQGSGFDQAAAYAGPATFDGAIVTFVPTTYNEYVNSAINVLGACTDGTSLTCNTLFDPAAILATEDSRERPFDSKQFGFNAGGPIMKDKWFIFGSYEGTLIDNPTPIFERVPSTFDKTYDPYATGGFGFLATDPSYVLGQNILGLYPAANVVAVPNVLEFYKGFAPNSTDVHNFLLRSDIVQTDKTSWSVRYAAQLLDQLHDATLPATATYPGNGAKRDAVNQNLNVSYNHSFNPAMVLEAHAGFNRFQINENTQDESLDAKTVGLPYDLMPTFLLSGLDTQYSGASNGVAGAYGGWDDSFWFGTTWMLPTLAGRFPMARIGAPLYAPSEQTDNTWFLSTTFAWNSGRHAWKFGGEYRHQNNDMIQGGLFRSLVYSSDIGEFTSDSETCNTNCGLAFFAPSFDYAQRQDAYVGEFKSNHFAFFVQDTYRIRPRVTLNYGVRYEWFSVPQEQNDRLWNFDPVANGLVQQNGAATQSPFGEICNPAASYQATYPDAGFGAFNWDCTATGNNRTLRSDTNNFAPRLGLAWDVFGTGNTVVRMGGGMYYSQMPVNYMAQLLYNRPTTFNATSPQFIYGQNDFGSGLNPCGGDSCGWGNVTINPAFINSNPYIGGAPSNAFQSAAMPSALYARDPYRSDTPMSWQINGSVQQQFGNHLVGEVGYVGNFGDSLPVVHNSNFRQQWNDPFCGGGVFCQINSLFPVFTMTNQGESSYHSLLARVRVGDWHGLRVNASYVWSSAFDNASNGIFPNVPITLMNSGLQGFFGTGNPLVFCQLGFAFGGCPPVTPPAPITSAAALTTTGAGAILTTPYTLSQDPYNYLRDDYGRSDYNSTHRFVADYTWDVPSLQKAYGWSKWMDYWQFSGIFTAQSGQPFTIFSNYGEITQRASATGAVRVSDNPNGAIDTSNLVMPSDACLLAGGSPYVDFSSGVGGAPCIGNTPRNAFTGPGFINMNFAIQKGFPLFGEGRMLTFRTEIYNLFGNDNFYNPISVMSTDGVTVNPDFGKIKSAHDPRQIQFGVRFTW